MLKGLGKVIGAFFIALAVILAAVQLLRWTALDEQDEAMLALARAAPAPEPGRNGYAALALSGHDVPADAIDAEMVAEVKDYTAWLAEQGEGILEASSLAAQGNDSGLLGNWSPRFAERYPARPPINFDSPLCSLNGTDCLARVRADTGAMRGFLAGESARLALVDQALSADHLQSPYPPSHQAPFLPIATLRLSLTQAAMDALDGRVPEALARTCRTLAGARRFTPGARDMLNKMVFPALAEASAALLLDIRREHPAEPLPGDCRDAVRPVQADDYLICGAMRGEFRMRAALSASQAAALAGRWTPSHLLSRFVLMDPGLQEAWLARDLVVPCTDDYRRDVMAGRVPPPSSQAVSSGDIHCYAAVTTCVLAEISAPVYGDYQGRMLDRAAVLRVLLAAQSVPGQVAIPAGLEAAAASPGYEVRFDPAARTLTVRRRFQRDLTDADFSVGF